MKRVLFLLICVLTATSILPSCVSNHRYRALRSNNAALMKKNEGLTNQLSMQKSAFDALTDTVTNLKANIASLNDINNSTSSELNMTKEQIVAQRARVKQLEDFLNQQQKATEALRQKIADALVNFKASELTVTMKDGKVYVSMQESLLFPSGSAVVNARGKDALAKLAGVLNTNQDIYINIEGHTDSVPIHNRMYTDNWSLSVARSVAIAHVLIDEYNVSPAHIVASGRSKYYPVADNTTAGGRALNRRTEIILEPKLDQLMQILNGSPATTKK